MTRPTLLAATAGAALLLAAVGQSVHLLTVAAHRPGPTDRRVVQSPVEPTRGAEQAAIRFTQGLLACLRTSTGPTDRPCGSISDIDTAPHPIDPTHVVVLLTATLHPQPRVTTRAGVPPTTPAVAAVPVALRLLVTRTSGAWVVVGGTR
jgi:hypothetical protein